MDDELDLLEAELQRLRPVAPSADLCAAIERRIARRGRIFRLSWMVLPIAAAVAILFTFSSSPRDAAMPAAGETKPATPGAAFKPVEAENLLLSARDEGYVTFADGTRARRMRRSYVDTITWRSPATNASLTWSVPREEVRVVPVSFQ